MEDLIQFTMDLMFFCVTVATFLFVAYVFIVFIGAVTMSIPIKLKKMKPG